MSILIKSPGALATIQDLYGAAGHLSDGFPSAGVMDRKSTVIANRLLGNCDTDAVIEMTMKGAVVVFLDRTQFCLTGADMSPALEGERVPMNTALTAFPGDTLTLGFAVRGIRTYLAVRGGFDVPAVMDSRSTNLKSGVGGYFGRKLTEGDIVAAVPVTPLKADGIPGWRIPYTPPTGGTLNVRAIPGPQDYMFTDSALETFFSTEYELSADSDRMGIRLMGEALESRDGVDIISDGIVFGSVQVPKNGQPIVLMADRQTTGGYAKIATVIECDLPILAQARPGDRVRFIKATPKDAADALRSQKAFYDTLTFK